MNSISEQDKLIEALGISKTYFREGKALSVLDNVDLDVYKGDMLCIQGASGAGKSTLLQILGTLDEPTKGSLIFEGESLVHKSQESLARFRLNNLGFVFQFHQLMSEFNALENIIMPCRIAQLNLKEAKSRAEKWAERLGVADRLKHYPSELSGGEQQRVAIARALVMEPKLLLADEPTGNLDSANTQNMADILNELHSEYGLTMVVVSHDENFAAKFPKRKRLIDGHWEKPSLDFKY
jgi:lipoprotein-releasing system ATP-binding protein